MNLYGANISSFQIEQINDSLFLSTGFFQKGRFVLFTANQEVETGDYPANISSNFPFHVHAIGYRSFITKNPKKSLSKIAQDPQIVYTNNI